MGPPSMAGTPGPGPFAAAAAAGGFNTGGYGGQGYGRPPSTFALPSGLGTSTSGYPPMSGSGGFRAGFRSLMYISD